MQSNDVLRAVYLLSTTQRVASPLQACIFQSASCMFLRMEFWKLNANIGGYLDVIATLVRDGLITISTRGLFLSEGAYTYLTLDNSQWTVVVYQGHVHASPEDLWGDFRSTLKLPAPRGELVITPYGMYCDTRRHEFITVTDKGIDVVNVSAENFTCKS